MFVCRKRPCLGVPIHQIIFPLEIIRTLNLTVDELEEIIVAEDSLLVHGDKEGLGEVHGRVAFGELDNVVSTRNRTTSTRPQKRAGWVT